MCHREVPGIGTVKWCEGHQVGLNGIEDFTRGDEVAISCSRRRPIGRTSQYPVPYRVN